MEGGFMTAILAIDIIRRYKHPQYYKVPYIDVRLSDSVLARDVILDTI
jgi:hypothetical protein